MKVDSRVLHQLLDKYQRERVAFVAGITDAAKQGESSAIMLVEQFQCHALLVPFLSSTNEPVLSNRVAAATALTILAHHSHMATTNLVASNVPAILIHEIRSTAIAPIANLKPRETAAIKKNYLACLRGICRWQEGAQASVNAEVLPLAIDFIKGPEPEYAEGAARLIDLIAAHSKRLSDAAQDAGAVHHLVSCLNKSEMAVKRAATAALGSILEQSEDPSVAKTVGSEAVGPLLTLLKSITVKDDKTAQHVLCTLNHMVNADPETVRALFYDGGNALADLSGWVVSSEALTARYAASILGAAASHDPALANLIAIKCGGCIRALVQQVTAAKILGKLPAILALGFIGGAGQTAADAVNGCGGVQALATIVKEPMAETVKAAAIWALGQIARHTCKLAQAVCDTGALDVISRLETSTESSQDLISKCNRTLLAITPLIERPAVLLAEQQQPCLEPIIEEPVSADREEEEVPEPKKKEAEVDICRMEDTSGNQPTEIYQVPVPQEEQETIQPVVEELPQNTDTHIVEEASIPCTQTPVHAPLEQKKEEDVFSRAVRQQLPPTEKEEVDSQTPVVDATQQETSQTMMGAINTDTVTNKPATAITDCDVVVTLRAQEQPKVHTEVAANTPAATDNSSTATA